MTKQETFDTIVRAVVVQGQPSVDPVSGTCRYQYLLEDGTILKCAAGTLIPNDKYEQAFEGKIVGDIVRDSVAENEAMRSSRLAQERLNHIITSEGHDMDLVARLQGDHDGSAIAGSLFVRTFMRRARASAEKFGLSTEVLDSLKEPY